MFKPVSNREAVPGADLIDIVVDGQSMRVPRHTTLAAALLGANVHTFRHTPVSGAPRGPLCMMGVCFDCLVEVDGVPNRQACMCEVEPGMRVHLPTGARALEGKK
ncbi:MAG: (2Fe-2S)-binding protein [Burkholderiaceae bacterium]|nr:(2Fe-2S)-binding protein [Burkholderiaceae bacterium]